MFDLRKFPVRFMQKNEYRKEKKKVRRESGSVKNTKANILQKLQESLLATTSKNTLNYLIREEWQLQSKLNVVDVLNKCQPSIR